MFELIHKLRQKPDSKKKQIAFIISLSFAGIIFVVWLSVIFPSWRRDQLRESEASKLEPSPTSAISSTFADGFSAMGEKLKAMKDALSTFSTEPEYYNSASSSENNLEQP
jgi:hypothetical protein